MRIACLLALLSLVLAPARIPTPTPNIRSSKDMPGVSVALQLPTIIKGPGWTREIIEIQTSTSMLTLAHPWIDGSLLLFESGVLLTPGKQYQGIAQSAQVTFVEPLEPGALINALYQFQQ
jgi:hypothetical protein